MRRTALVAMAFVALSGCGRPVLPPPPARPAAVDHRTALARAIQLIDGERFAEAVPQFQSLLQSYPELEDYHLYYLGVALAQTAQPEAATAMFRRLLRDHPRSVKRDDAALALGRIELESRHVEPARTLLRSAALAHERSVAQSATLLLAQADIEAGDVTEAADLLQSLRTHATGGDVGAQAKVALQRLRAAHPELAPIGPQLYDELRVLLAERDYAAAEALAARLLAEAPAEERIDLLPLDAQALLGLGRVDDAIATLRAVVHSAPGSRAASALFRIASVLWNRDRDREALVAFGDLTRTYPRSTHRAEALYAIGCIHERGGRTADAIAAYRKLVQTVPRDKLAREARWRIAWIQYAGGKWDTAAASFAALAKGHGAADAPDALYWQARALDHAGRGAAARGLYRRIADEAPTSYYAMWAEQRLGDVSPATPVIAPRSDDGATPPPVSDYHFQRAVELKAAQLFAPARAELAAYEREHEHDEPELRRVLQWYPTVDGYALALRLSRRLGSAAGLSTTARQRLSYPLGFWSEIQAAAAPAGLDPVLVAALIRQESLFDPTARSPADARGLMQLLPSTAQRVAGAPVSARELDDAQRNIALGTRHLAQLLAQFGGDELKALAAYNGGEAAVEKWQQRFGERDRDEWVESISFRETRDYVKRVIAGARQYRRLYGAVASDE